MRRSRVTSVAPLALLLVLVPQISACTAIHETTVAAVPHADKISGITTVSGRNINFDPVGATISGGKLYANGPNGQIVIPTDSVKTVWTKEFSAGRTAGVVLATAAVLGIFVALANKTAGSSSSGY